MFANDEVLSQPSTEVADVHFEISDIQYFNIEI